MQAELRLVPEVVVNSAGLAAVPLARRLMGLDNSLIPTTHYARGHYFSLSKTKVPPFRHLIYPIPEDGGLGVHVTLDLDGQVKFGPDVEWIGGVPDVANFLNRYSIFGPRMRCSCFCISTIVVMFHLILIKLSLESLHSIHESE